MAVSVQRVDVWVASIEDRPGGLSDKLKQLAEAGANLEFAIARRAPDKPGTGVVFVTPLEGDAQTAAAKKAGFAVADSLHSVRIEGDDKPGIGAELTKSLADAGINLRGLSAAVKGGQFIMYLGLDSAQDADKAQNLLQGTS
jgi:hypothetical protein